MFEIDNLCDLVKDYLGDEREFLDYKTSNLTAPGDNYGSLILCVEVKVKNRHTNEEEVVKVVGKTPPPSDFAQQLFNTIVTFKNEIQFYRNIWPELLDFQESHGVKSGQYVARYAGARWTDSGEVDKNAVLLLENLAVSGFTVLNRMVGFDLETAKLILKSLANFHATVVAYKLQKPADFKTKIIPYVDGMIFYTSNQEDPMMTDNINRSIDYLLEKEDTKNLGLKARKFVDNEEQRTIESAFATVVHADLWVNNVMLKLDKNQNPIETKLVDFQVLRYQSPADDLLFFLLTSVQDNVIINKLEELIQFYHKHFVATLEQLKCDTKPFSYENFQNEIRNAKYEQFNHIVCMLFPIFLEKDKVKDMKDFKPDEGAPPLFELNDRQKEKLVLVAQCYDKMGWFD